MTDMLRTLLNRRKAGYTLEAPFHTDPAIFHADLDIIFGRHWVYVGVEPDVPDDGGLKFAAHMREDFDRTCHGLRRVHIRSLAGLLFVCLAETPPGDFDTMAE